MSLRLIFILSLAITTAHAQSPPVNAVNPFIGTAGDHGQLSPAACVPFGLVQPGPDTDPISHSGYDYDARRCLGFSINRIQGTGCKGSGGNLRIMPGLAFKDTSTRISKANEKAEPGYYAITYANGIKAEMTATNAVGWERFTYPKNAKPWLMVDPTTSLEKLTSSTWEQVGKRTLQGSYSARTVCNRGIYMQYYAITFNHDIEQLKLDSGRIWIGFAGATVAPLSLQKYPKGSNAPLPLSAWRGGGGLGGEGEVLDVKVTISTINPNIALRQGKLEIAGRSFQQIRTSAKAAWAAILSNVQVEGGTQAQRTLFYTMLYRCFQSPFLTGVGRYEGWSIWDTYRTRFPLLALVAPEYMRTFAKSLCLLYRQGKRDWARQTEPTPTVRTEHSQIVLLDAYRKGLLPLDSLKNLLPYLEREADTLLTKSPDQRLEAAHDLWAISEICKELDDTACQASYQRRAMGYKDTYRQYFATMDDKADIMHGEGLYEGTRWQYRWAVPFDIPGMIELQGGKPAFTAQLEHFFDSSLYSAGNEPDIHAPYLFNYSAKPWLTQTWLHALLCKPYPNWYGTHRKWKQPKTVPVFAPTPDGLLEEMDDDDGTMAAWYVWGALGLYPLRVGEPVYELGLPLFLKATVVLGNGKKLTIQTTGLSDKSYHIQKVTFNSKPIRSRHIPHGLLMQGGVLGVTYGAGLGE